MFRIRRFGHRIQVRVKLHVDTDPVPRGKIFCQNVDFQKKNHKCYGCNEKILLLLFLLSLHFTNRFSLYNLLYSIIQIGNHITRKFFFSIIIHSFIITGTLCGHTFVLLLKNSVSDPGPFVRIRIGLFS